MACIKSISVVRCLQLGMVAALSVASRAGYADEASIVYYDVTGHSARQVRHELDTKGPLDRSGERFDGFTSWRVSWTYRYMPDGNGCKFTTMSATVAGTIVLPRWEQEDHASASVGKKWDRYLVALRSHEDGHYAHGIAARDEIENLGKSFRVPGPCTTIAKAFDDRANAISARYNRLDIQYDQETDHGETQGAVFP